VGLSSCRRHAPPDWQPSIVEPPPRAPVVVAAPRAPAPWPPPLIPSPPTPAPPPPELGLPDGGADGGVLVVTVRTDGGTVNGHPQGPRAADLEAIVRRALPTMERCVDSAELPANVDVSAYVRYRILPIGRTGTVEVQGNLPPASAACVKAIFDGLRFPRFEGEPIDSGLPFSLRRDVLPAQ